MANKAVFFDRDGTLNVDVHYLYRIEDFQWTEDAIAAIKYCNDQDWRVIVITNQSGVARGYYTEQDIQRLHGWMNEDLAKYGAHIDAFYYCPHHPDGSVPQYAVACDCRKPKPGMFERIAGCFNTDLAGTYAVGDSLRDLQAAVAAGARPVLVLSGKGRNTQKENQIPEGTLVFDDLAATVEYLLKS